MKRMFAVILIVVLSLVLIPQGAVGMPAGPQSADYLPSLSGGIPIAGYEAESWSPAVAYNWKHQEYFVVWHNDDTDGTSRIYGQRIDARTGALIGPQPDAIAGGSQDKTEPDVDYDPVNDRYLVVWQHNLVTSGYDISGRFVPWEGSLPTLPEFKISGLTNSQVHPKVAYGRADQQFMVVWTHMVPTLPNISYIGGNLVPANGSAPNPSNEIIISTGTSPRDFPDIAYNRSRNQFLVVYDALMATDWDIYGNLFSGAGVKTPADILLAISLDDEHYASVASCAGQDQWLVTWQPYIVSDYDLKGMLFTGGISNIANLTISGFAGEQEHCQVSCNYGENSYMVTWQEEINNAIGISARPVMPDGTLGTGLQVWPPSGLPGNNDPAVAGGHTNFLVVWQNLRYDGNRDIYGRLLTPYKNYLPLSLKSP